VTEKPVALQLLLTGYVHLDWAWEYATPEDAVAHFIAAEPRETLRSAQAELAELLETTADHQIDQSG
jgi:hypothetical protein